MTLIGEPASERDVGERQRLRAKQGLGSLDAVPQQPAMRRYARLTDGTRARNGVWKGRTRQPDDSMRALSVSDADIISVARLSCHAAKPPR